MASSSALPRGTPSCCIAVSHRALVCAFAELESWWPFSSSTACGGLVLLNDAWWRVIVPLSFKAAFESQSSKPEPALTRPPPDLFAVVPTVQPLVSHPWLAVSVQPTMNACLFVVASVAVCLRWIFFWGV